MCINKDTRQIHDDEYNGCWYLQLWTWNILESFIYAGIYSLPSCRPGSRGISRVLKSSHVTLCRFVPWVGDHKLPRLLAEVARFRQAKALHWGLPRSENSQRSKEKYGFTAKQSDQVETVEKMRRCKVSCVGGQLPEVSFLPTNNATLQQSWTLCGCCSAISEQIRVSVRHQGGRWTSPWRGPHPCGKRWSGHGRCRPFVFPCFPCRLVSPWEQTTAFVWTWMAVMSSAFLAFLAFLDHSAGCELSELRSWSGHGQHELNGHRAGVSDWSGPQDIPRHPKTTLRHFAADFEGKRCAASVWMIFHQCMMIFIDFLMIFWCLIPGLSKTGESGLSLHVAPLGKNLSVLQSIFLWTRHVLRMLIAVIVPEFIEDLLCHLLQPSEVRWIKKC